MITSRIRAQSSAKKRELRIPVFSPGPPVLHRHKVGPRPDSYRHYGPVGPGPKSIPGTFKADGTSRVVTCSARVQLLGRLVP
jgi:hypothetical protein